MSDADLFGHSSLGLTKETSLLKRHTFLKNSDIKIACSHLFQTQLNDAHLQDIC